METLYFTLGIAFVVVAAIAVVAVRAVIMVEKLKEQLGSTHQDITMVERTIMNHLDSFIRSCDQRFDNEKRDRDYELSETHRALDLKCDSIERMVDSRVDKLHHQMKEAFPAYKQLLKG